jgi:hypothetical protein
MAGALTQRPSIGRIVWVRSPAFVGECPAIITAVFNGGDSTYINCRVFTNQDDGTYGGAACPLITSLQMQDESSVGWGWRWPPEVVAKIMRDIPQAELDAMDLRPGAIGYDTENGDASGLPGAEPE